VLHCVAVCCSVLQCVAVCCSVLQCVAVQCVAVTLSNCSVLQCVVVRQTPSPPNTHPPTHTHTHTRVSYIHKEGFKGFNLNLHEFAVLALGRGRCCANSQKSVCYYVN